MQNGLIVRLLYADVAVLGHYRFRGSWFTDTLDKVVEQLNRWERDHGRRK